MKINVEVICQEFVKPSSPTSHHLRHLKFSFPDQNTPKVAIPFVHFYSGETTVSNLAKCNLLKQSLSQVLTLFYPLAGRIRNDSYVDCNDEGFLYVEAKTSCTLSDVLRERNPINNNYFTPFRPEKIGDLGGFAQITLFECGGLAISFAMCHKLGDASSNFTFLSSWAALARGETQEIIAPSFGHAAAFPPLATLELDDAQTFSEEKLVTKIFEFDRSSVEALKAKYAMKGNGRELSRLEALTGFIIGRYNASTQSPRANNRLYQVLHMVDMRRRVEPPMAPKLSFGNISTIATIEAQIDAKDEYGFGVAERMKDSISDSTDYFNKHRHNADQMWNYFKPIRETYGDKEVVSFSFSGLNKFPMYETDLGWGKPLWVGTTPLYAQNLAFLFGTKDGEGIEAWISLNEEDMAKFEADVILLQHASSSSHGRLVYAHSRM